ncbi:tetratricopeptide repeat protein [Pseudoalteromonas sp. Hal099]
MSEQQNWQTIIEQTQIWLDYQNDNSHFLYALAHAYYQLEDFISALTTIERMPSNHPLQAEVTALHAMMRKLNPKMTLLHLPPTAHIT